jgi:hypothetical protein
MEAVGRFFEKIHTERRKKGFLLKILMDEKDKDWALSILRYPKYDKVRFVKHSFPSEVNIWADNVMIIMLTKVPVVTLIKSKVTAAAFRNYFNTLWKTAKK